MRRATKSPRHNFKPNRTPRTPPELRGSATEALVVDEEDLGTEVEELAEPVAPKRRSRKEELLTPYKEAEITDKKVSLGALLSKRPIFQPFETWLVGDTPLITHAWSEKAKIEMLQKQVKATRSGKEARDPERDFLNSLYDMGDNKYGFPVTGVKNCILSAAHKDKGIARSSVLGALFLDAEMIRTRPGLAGAVCDMPLVQIHGSNPEMREDMVRIGAGLQKVSNLAYRAQFTVWALKISGRFNPAVLTAEALTFLIQESGVASGLGEWRNERKGVFGAFHLATAEEETAWNNYVAGKGPLPVPASMRKLAAA